MDKKIVALDFPCLGYIFWGFHEPRFFPISQNSDFCCGRHPCFHASCSCKGTECIKKYCFPTFPGRKILGMGFPCISSNLVTDRHDVFFAHAIFGRRMVRLGDHHSPRSPYPMGPLVSSLHFPIGRARPTQDLGRTFNN